MRRWMVLAMAGACCGAAAAEPPGVRLVVVIAVDQLRGDYPSRCAEVLLPPGDEKRPGGFAFLLREGAAYSNAHHEHWPLVTAPGHAVIMTGALPGRTGIVGNEWWDVAAAKVVSSERDDRWRPVGIAEGSAELPAGPGNLRVSTVGDELKRATAGRARTASISLKDRPAILMGGHTADACIWYDAQGGRWVSSTAYCPDGKLPAWVEEVNGRRIPDKALGATWEPSVSEAALSRLTTQAGIVGSGMAEVMGARFPHRIGAEKSAANYSAFLFTPWANAMTLETALAAVEAMGLGADDCPDVLTISLSATDYVGHTFGPYSPEAVDAFAQTDRQLAAFLGALGAKVGLSRVVVVLTADHGVCPIPEDAAAGGDRGGRFSVRDVTAAVSGALTRRFGEPEGGTWFARSKVERGVAAQSGAFVDGMMYLSPAAVEQAISSGKARSRRDIEDAACDGVSQARVAGVRAVYGRTQAIEGRIGDPALRERLGRSVHPLLSGDLIVVPEPFFLPERSATGNATTHGAPYAYDTHVPLIVYAPGRARAGVYPRRVSTASIAPTLSLILGTEFPSGCEGQPLEEALGGK